MSIQTNRNYFNLYFFINKSKVKKDGKCPILLRITINKKPIALSLKRTVEPQFWDSDSGIVKRICSDHESLNMYIDAVRSKAYEKYTELMTKHDAVTSGLLRDAMLGIHTASTPTVVGVWQEHCDFLKDLIGRETSYTNWQKYTTCLTYFKEFLLKDYRTKDVNMKIVDRELVTRFERFIKIQKGCSYNTTIKYLQNFKKITKIGLNNGWIKLDPFSHLKLTLKEVDRPYLDQHELQTLIDKTISIPRIELVRDLFVFSCFTGLAYADIKKLHKGEIERSPDGFSWIRTKRKKTGVRANIPLLEVPIQIINKWTKFDKIGDQDLLLPVLSNQKMNAYLKEIASLCGINKSLCFHSARHTFATTVTLMHGVPIESVSKMLGHKDIKQTQHYARVVDQKVGEDMRMLSSKLNQSLSTNATRM